MLSQEILRTDVTGMPLEWIDYQQAAKLIATDQISYALGSMLYRIRGGTNAATGIQSCVEINAILATRGQHANSARLKRDYAPPLSNRALFKRDQNLCLYCGERFRVRDLSRDHITPVSQGGLDLWTNVVTACKRCNNHKAGRTPEESGMQLLAIPFTPTYAEYVYLQGKRVMADQMSFLLAHFPRNSPLRRRLERQQSAH